MLKILRQKDRGFTLIELLVVTAIIGILATVVLVSLDQAKVKARDIKRLADIRQLALALELYYNDTSSYIDVVGCVVVNETNLGDLTPDVIGVLPGDPINGSYYYYGASSDNQDYVIRTVTENNAPAGGYTEDIYSCGCDQPNEYCIIP